MRALPQKASDGQNALRSCAEGQILAPLVFAHKRQGARSSDKERHRSAPDDRLGPFGLNVNVATHCNVGF